MVYGILENCGGSLVLEQDGPESIYTADIKGSLRNIIDVETNFSRLMEAVGMDELSYYAESGQIMVYESGKLSGFIGKLKEFFRNIWTKVSGLIKKFLMAINSMIMSDKDFVNKYKGHLMKIDTRDFEYKGFEYDIIDFDKHSKPLIAHVAATLPHNLGKSSHDNIDKQKSAVEEWTGKKEDKLEELRGIAVEGSKGKKYTMKEYHEALFSKLRKNESSKVTISKVNIPEILETINNYKDAKKSAENAKKSFEKIINNIIKELDNSERELNKKVPDDRENKDAHAMAIKYISTRSGALKDALAIAQVLNGAILSALKQQRAQNKMVCVKLINYKPKNEGYNPEYGSGGSVLENVTFV